MRSLRLLFVFVVLALSLEAAWTPTCTSFVYVNGINTRDIDAAGTVTNLLVPQFRTHLTNQGKTGYCYSIHFLYSQSAGFTDDFSESARLFFNQNDQALNKFINRNDLFQTGTSTEQAALAYTITKTPSSNLVSTFAQTRTAQTTASVITNLPPSEQFTTRGLVNRLLGEINANKTAVCIGHSEGNFFCNLAYRVIAEDNPSTFQTLNVTQPGLSKLSLSLPNPQVLQVIGIATPADFTADGRNQYVTVCRDAILAVPNALPANYPSVSSCTNWWNNLWNMALNAFSTSFQTLLFGSSVSLESHLIETYLASGSGTQNTIMQMMEKSIVDATTITTTYTLGPTNSDDAWVTDIYYGGGLDNKELRVGGWGDSYYTLFKLNIGGMPTNATKAELRFYEYPVTGTRGQMYLDRVTGPWTESTKWATKPASTNLSTLPSPVDNQWYTIDITNLYNSWQNGSYPNYGIMLRPLSISNVFNYFRSSEYSTDISLRPRLVLTYSSSTSPPTNTSPAITLSGANPMSVAVGTQFVEPGYTATDTEDGNITVKVAVSGTVNTSQAGTYTKTYSVTDNGGLSVSKTRTVNVIASSGNTTTYQLTPSQCSVVWVTDWYYGGGMHDGDMKVGGWGDTYYSLIKCSFAGMPASATTVKLRLYQYPSPSGGGRSQIYFDRVTGSWDNTTKWQTMPTSTNISLLPTPADNQWYEIDITALYNGWQAGTYPNYGIMLRPYSNSNIFNVFRSTEYSDPNFRPQLVVTAGTPAPNTAPPLTGSCAVNGSMSSINLQPGNTAYYGAGWSGGTGPIHFLWTGATGGDTPTPSQLYNYAGTYTASVRITDSGSPQQQVTATCPQVNVATPNPTPSPAPSPLSVSCSFSPNSIVLGNVASMFAMTNGGYAPYLYQFPGDSGFGSASSKSFAVSSVGTFSYVIYTRDSQGTTAISPPCSVTVSSPTLTVTNALATPNPVRKQATLLVQIWGSNFMNGTTQVTLLGPGICSIFGSCPMSITSFSSTYLESRLSVNYAGTYTVWVRNGTGGWVLAPSLTLTVTE